MRELEYLHHAFPNEITDLSYNHQLMWSINGKIYNESARLILRTILASLKVEQLSIGYLMI